jgi:hypothetical protein
MDAETIYYLSCLVIVSLATGTMCGHYTKGRGGKWLHGFAVGAVLTVVFEIERRHPAIFTSVAICCRFPNRIPVNHSVW